MQVTLFINNKGREGDREGGREGGREGERTLFINNKGRKEGRKEGRETCLSRVTNDMRDACHRLLLSVPITMILRVNNKTRHLTTLHFHSHTPQNTGLPQLGPERADPAGGPSAGAAVGPRAV
jgi:hypothetical protein